MEFEIYSKPSCSYCEQAKQVLSQRGISYVEKIIDVGQQKVDGKIYVSVQQLRERLPSAKTVPQIFLGETHIGGFDALTQYLQKAA